MINASLMHVLWSLHSTLSSVYSQQSPREVSGVLEPATVEFAVNRFAARMSAMVRKILLPLPALHSP